MRIDGKTQLGMDTLEYASKKKSVEKNSSLSANATHTASSAAASDAVIISGRAKETSALTRTLRELPDVRKNRVEELKSQIAAGTYNVSGKSIAEKVVNTALSDLF